MIRLPSRVELQDVPLYTQEAQQCGPAALAMALSWSGIPTTPEALVPRVYTPALKGSLQTAIVGAARRSGRVAYPLSGTEALLREVAAGHPVIVLLNLGLSWYPKWHYAVVTGYDLAEGFIVLHSGKTEPEYLPFRVFENTWARSRRWGLLVLQPGDLPVTAEETSYLAAVLGLEKAHRWHEAVEGYQTALQQWPGSLPALMGLGNSLYALRELARAEKVFQDAARLHPTSGAAFNNLAQVLWEEGRQEAALAAARKAVALGGPLSATYRKTLKEIQSGNP
ncbi:MAG: PA2778 family cysteine peptidase [Deltaproteobacteria bacterium]|nr:PA2778 family cysteine peptidase [Deltaproteobacteria bacterium]